MKIVVINRLLKETHKEQIRKAAAVAGGSVLFVGSEEDIPSGWEDCEVIY
jgi:hypothetical protein